MIKKTVEMGKTRLIWLVLFLGLTYKSSAKYGMASDEKELILSIIVFLLLVAGFFEGIDYLKKNGKSLLAE